MKKREFLTRQHAVTKALSLMLYADYYAKDDHEKQQVASYARTWMEIAGNMDENFVYVVERGELGKEKRIEVVAMNKKEAEQRFKITFNVKEFSMYPVYKVDKEENE